MKHIFGPVATVAYVAIILAVAAFGLSLAALGAAVSMYASR